MEKSTENLGEIENGFTEFAARIKAGKVSITLFLEHWHEIFVKLSPSQIFQQDEYGDDIRMRVSNRWLSTKMKYSDILDISILINEELYKHFDLLLYGLPPIIVLDEHGCLSSSAKRTHKEFVLLLRCSLVILKFLQFDTFHVFENCQLFITMLRKLCKMNSSLQLPFQSTDKRDVLAILEVCLDKFTMDDNIMAYFIMADDISTTDEKLFLPNYIFGEVHAIMELVSTHFIVSYHDETTFGNFIDSLYWSNLDAQNPAITLDSALALLNDPVISTASHLLQAHLIILASRCDGIHNSKALALELSVQLYIHFILKINGFDDIFQDGSIKSSDDARPSFNSCIQPLAYDKLRQQIDKLNDWCHASTWASMSKTRAEIQEDAIAYIKDSQSVIQEKIGDEVFQVLTCLVRSLLAEESKWSSEDYKTILQELYCVSAVLKLMSSILLQLLPFLTKNKHLDCTRSPEQITEYDSILSIISSVGNYGENKHAQKFLFGVVESNNERHSDIKLMFAHFTSLLSYSFTSKVGPLWKSCIFIMIPILNLLIIEEGNLNAFNHLLQTVHISPLTFHSDVVEESAHRPSSITICSNFQRVRNRIQYLKHDDHRMEKSNDGSVDLCSGENFLKCLSNFHKNNSNCEDLADFIDCTPGKDYSVWMKHRAVFRKWKYRKFFSRKRNAKGRFQQNIRAFRQYGQGKITNSLQFLFGLQENSFYIFLIYLKSATQFLITRVFFSS